jgi:HSP20 family protein
MAGSSQLTDRIQRMLSETLGGLDWQYRDSAAASWVPAVDIFEEADKIRITAELPGVKPEDIEISLEGNVLTVRGTKQQDAEERTERMHRYERIYGVFERSFTLPSSVEPKDIKANYDNGVLTITLPKSEKAKPRQIAVETGGRGQQVQIGQNNQGSEGGQGNQGNQWTPEKERSSSRRSEAEKQSR